LCFGLRIRPGEDSAFAGWSRCHDFVLGADAIAPHLLADLRAVDSKLDNCQACVQSAPVEKTVLRLDPSRPFQVEGPLLAFWLPRGRGRDEVARGLVCAAHCCANPGCLCTDADLTAVPIDDRVQRVELVNSSMKLVGRSGGDLPDIAPIGFLLDIVTGAARGIDGGPLPADVVPFLEAPFPGWVLDHLFARWRDARPCREIRWQDGMLGHWLPGEMLSFMETHPDERFDQYLVGGKKYQADILFCGVPACSCLDGRWCLFEVRRKPGVTMELHEVGSARLLPDDMTPVDRLVEPGAETVFADVFSAWKQRHAPPKARFMELRKRTRLRGAELCDLMAKGALPLPPTRRMTNPKPSRNAPCPCGSGRKYKRCCGQVGKP